MPPHDERARLASWIERLRELAVLCEQADENSAGDLLLEIEQAVSLCPRALKPWFAPSHRSIMSADLLQAGGHVSFALGLCSDAMSYLLSKSLTGQALVTIALPELEQEASFVSDALPLAIAGAVLTLTVEAVGGEMDPSLAPKRAMN